jgi:hypothetical protein
MTICITLLLLLNTIIRHKVANPKSLLQFAKQRNNNTNKKKIKRRAGEIAFDLDDIGDIEDNAAGHSKMEDIVSQRLSEPDSKLQILPESAFSYAVHQFVNKNSSKAISNFVEESLEQMQKELRSNSTFNSGEGEEELTKALKKRHKKIDNDIAKKRNKEKKPKNDDDSEDSDDSGGVLSPSPSRSSPSSSCSSSSSSGDDDDDDDVDHDGSERKSKKKIKKSAKIKRKNSSSCSSSSSKTSSKKKGSKSRQGKLSFKKNEKQTKNGDDSGDMYSMEEDCEDDGDAYVKLKSSKLGKRRRTTQKTGGVSRAKKNIKLSIDPVTIDIVDSDEDSDDDDEVQFSGSITSQVSSNGRAVSSKRRGVASRRKISRR